MLKFLIMAGLFFGIALGGILAFYAVVTIGILLSEFADNIERKYGFRGSIICFLVGLAIVSLIAASILTFLGV